MAKILTSAHILHIRKSTLERYHINVACGKLCSGHSSLAIHQRIHDGVKPYKCNECCKVLFLFFFNLDLWEIHTGENPYIVMNA